MDRLVRRYPNNLLIIVESSEHSHKQIIESTVAKRAYQIFGRINSLEFSLSPFIYTVIVTSSQRAIQQSVDLGPDQPLNTEQH